MDLFYWCHEISCYDELLFTKMGCIWKKWMRSNALWLLLACVLQKWNRTMKSVRRKPWPWHQQMKVTILVISPFPLDWAYLMEMWVGRQFFLHTVHSVMYCYPSYLKDIKGKVMSCLNWTSLCSSQESIGAYEWIFSTLFKTRGWCPPAHTVPIQMFKLWHKWCAYSSYYLCKCIASNVP